MTTSQPSAPEPAVLADGAAIDDVDAALPDATATAIDPDIAGLLKQVATRMGGVSERDALHRSLRTMLALYDAKAQGGEPVVRYDRTEQSVNLPGAS